MNAPMSFGRPRWLILPAVVLVATLGAICFDLLHHRRSSGIGDSDREAANRLPPPIVGAVGAPAPNVAPIEKETPPWESTPENTPNKGPGFVPAWQVQPAPPISHEWSRPQEPPNPITHRPPMTNPGGVNGARPERASR